MYTYFESKGLGWTTLRRRGNWVNSAGNQASPNCLHSPRKQDSTFNGSIKMELLKVRVKGRHIVRFKPRVWFFSKFFKKKWLILLYHNTPQKDKRATCPLIFENALCTMKIFVSGSSARKTWHWSWPKINKNKNTYIYTYIFKLRYYIWNVKNNNKIFDFFFWVQYCSMSNFMFKSKFNIF